MANAQATKPSNADAIKAFKDKNPAKKLPDGGVAHGEIKEAAKPEEAQPEPEPIQPKTFQCLPYSQGNIEGVVCAMSMLDINDYVAFDDDLYDINRAEDNFNPAESWQRKPVKARGKEIAAYLKNELHFFPSMTCVVASDDVELSEDGTSITLTGGENGKGSLGALDGQHRKLGIQTLLSDADHGPNSAFASEQIPVVIITSGISLSDKQQIFSDINRTPKTASKALAILFDTRDQYAVIAHAIAKNLGGEDMVDLTRTSPGKNTTQCCSMSNIYAMVVNFAATEHKHQKPMRENLNAAIVTNVVTAMVKALPKYEYLRLNSKDFSFGLAKAAYPVCYSSTGFQGMGRAMTMLLHGVKPEDMPAVAAKLVSDTDWSASNPVWSAIRHDTSGKAFAPIVDSAGKVGTRTEHVSSANSLLESMWSKPVDANQEKASA